ncbi:hypothetical protein GF406_10170 [candidate division KSB1 bacterium]|nr:hypothetical protein [candidate division KSB1 bacterium]
MNNVFYLNVLPPEQRKLLHRLAEQQWIRPFYLVGGTALALHLGHRQSIDFDFFTFNEFDQNRLLSDLNQFGSFELFDQSSGTINGALDKIKISFLRYDYPLLKPSRLFQLVSVADIFDIALTKLAAISGRGAKKDFIDLYFILGHYSLDDLLPAYEEKFGPGLGNLYHLQKSLVYFEDAENQPMPLMLKPVSWPKIKETLIKEVRDLGIA